MTRSRHARRLRWKRRYGLEVFFLRHLSLPIELAGVLPTPASNGLAEGDAGNRRAPLVPAGRSRVRVAARARAAPERGDLRQDQLLRLEGTPLDIALRDCGVNAFAISGVATEIGIEPTVRHGADLGYIAIVVTDACGAGHEDAGQRALPSIAFMGDAFLTDVATFEGILARHTDS